MASLAKVKVIKGTVIKTISGAAHVQTQGTTAWNGLSRMSLRRSYHGE